MVPLKRCLDEGSVTLTNRDRSDPAEKTPRSTRGQPDASVTAERARIVRIFYLALAISLTVSALLFFVWTWRWPLVGDASAMHYLVFLMERGWVPYRQLADQQFPGAYLVEFAGMHLFGPDDLGWRLFDFALLGLGTVAFFAVTRSPSRTGPQPATSSAVGSSVNTLPTQPANQAWLPGLFAAALFILIHGRDGLAQGGQRDLTMAIVLLAATALLFHSVRRGRIWPSAIFGLLSGLACSIKPTVLPLSVAQLAFACIVSRQRGQPWVPRAAAAAVAMLFVPLVSLAFLLREHAVAAFLAGLRTVVPYYASLAHRPLMYVLLHSISPVQALVLLWMAVLVLGHAQPLGPRHGNPDWKSNWTRNWERTTLVSGALFALFDCILQARALPYYRYPLLAYLLPLIALDLHSAFQRSVLDTGPGLSSLRRRSTAALASLALAFGGFVLAPQSAVLIHRYRWWQTGFITALEQDLNALGGPALSRHIQCMDSVSGCASALYAMRLEPCTGVLGDYILFGPDTAPAVRQMRQQFTDEIRTNPPRVIVVSSHLHFDTAEDFQKLARWPAFSTLLATQYTLVRQWSPSHSERWWSREEYPASYRIYTLRAAP